MELNQKKCVPCEGGVPKLTAEEIAVLAPKVAAWRVVDHRRLQRRFEFENFVAALAFVNRMADLAEREGHHPDFSVQYSLVDVTIWTHAIGGLSENDFILAAKIDQL
ncbi:MAG: 4a-hydroxytetrahydrobiopterin dehydratase [Myxococcales bacterium]|nr:4a-hydroxytetrahydrobiopterin dehydratase [Myxococcales bacterium]